MNRRKPAIPPKMLGSPKALKKSVPSIEPTIVDPKRPLIQIPATRAYRAIGAPLPNAGAYPSLLAFRSSAGIELPPEETIDR